MDANRKIDSAPDRRALVRMLERLDLNPLSLEVRTDAMAPTYDRVEGDIIVDLRWGDEQQTFIVQVKKIKSMRNLREVIRDVRLRGEKIGARPLVVVPHLSYRALELLREEEISGVDLAGNARIIVPGKWMFFTGGRQRVTPKERTRSPYRGKSSLVGRAFMVRPFYSSVSDIREEIERKGGTISLGQVSKVLKALEDDLIVERTPDGIGVVRPARLLDELVTAYASVPIPRNVLARGDSGPDLLPGLLRRAESAGLRIAGFEPGLYAIAPETTERIVIYIDQSPDDDLLSLLGLEQTERFANIEIRSTDEQGVYFDLREVNGFPWCSPLHVYMELMRGGKREKEIAQQLRSDLLRAATG